MSKENKIAINGSEYTFQAGETILDVARRNHIHIPTLCHLKRAKPTGACRICVVEIKGARSLMTSCSMPASSGMEVQTESDKVLQSRKMVVKLLLSSGDHNCIICPSNADCGLQDLAYQFQLESEFPETYKKHDLEDENPFIVRDFSKCILCGRCVQACNDVQVNNAIDFGYRGAETKIVASGDKALKDSDCVFCGECVQVCPTGALTEKNDRFTARPWETKKVRTTCSYCGVGCQINLHIKDNQVVKVTGLEDVAPNYGSLCVKGRYGFDFINSKERLTTPLIKENGLFREAEWEEALNLIAEKFGALQKQFGGDQLGLLASARITNEENYIAQKFARAVLKTNNVDHCARLCHSSTVSGLATTFGSGAMTNRIEDFEKADVILVTGSNTTESHPVISTYIKRAVKHNGAKLIVVDPRQIGLVKHATKWLQPKLGTDVAWINGMCHVIIKKNLYDKTFVEKRTEDFKAMAKLVESYTPEYVSDITGVSADDIVETAVMYGAAKAGSIAFCMGITQHTVGTDNVKCLANLAMLCGNLGIEGGGVNPLRGQNNVQGACDLGGLPDVYTGYQKVTNPDVKEKMEKAWGVKNLSPNLGLTVTEMIPKAMEGQLKGMYVIGENPLVSDPDVNHAEQAFKKLDFLVVQDIFMNETAQLADVVLPSVCFAEKDGSFTNTERKVQYVRKAINGPGRSRTDWEIICEIARLMGYPMSYDSSADIMDEIASVTPSYGGISHHRIKNEDLCWPCPTPDHTGTPILHQDTFIRGKGIFTPVIYKAPVEECDSEYPLSLTTGRILYQYHTRTMTRRTEGLNDIAGECFVEISCVDGEKLEIQNGEKVKISSRRGEIEAVARVADCVMPGNVFIPFHFAEAAANRLTIAALDPVSKIPEFKVCAVKVEKK